MEPAPQDTQPIVEESQQIQDEKKAYVYKLQCNDGYYYYGSTKNKINFRLNNHKQDSKKYPERKIYNHINEIGWDCVDIKIIKEISFIRQTELKQEENYFIKQAKIKHDEYCLNENFAKLTPEERKEMMKNYYEKNKEDILEKQEQYREENRESINNKIAEYRKTNDKHREYNRKYKQEHKEIRKNYPETAKKYYDEHKEQISENHKKWIEQNKEHCQEYSKQYYETQKDSDEFKEKRKKQTKKYYEENYDAVREKNKKYYEDNKEKILEQQKEKNKYEDCEQIQCDCGGKYVTYHKKRHMESKKHLKFQASQNVN
jgi:hypothetical protein